MVALTGFEDRLELALKDDVIQAVADGDTNDLWKHLNEIRSLLTVGVPVR